MRDQRDDRSAEQWQWGRPHLMPLCDVDGCDREALGACRSCRRAVCGAHRVSEMLCARCMARRQQERGERSEIG